MGFIAPFLPAIAKGAIGIGSSLLGSKLSGGSGGVQGMDSLLNEQAGAVKTGHQLASNLAPQAQNLLSGATSAYSPALSYWSSLLNGNRGAAMQAAAPDINRINAGYHAQTQSAGNLMPRGGGRSALFAEAPFRRQQDITSLLQTQRQGAAPGLTSIGNAMGSTGSSLYNSLLQSLTGNTGNLLNYDLASRAQQYQKGKDIGGSIFDILKGVPDIFKGKGKLAPDIPFSAPYLPGN